MRNSGESEHQQGIALSDTGDFAGALAAYDAALTKSPSEASIHYSRANSLVMLNQLEPAVAAYDACIRLDPNHVSAYYNRATAMARLQRWAEALSGLDQALPWRRQMTPNARRWTISIRWFSRHVGEARALRKFRLRAWR